MTIPLRQVLVGLALFASSAQAAEGLTSVWSYAFGQVYGGPYRMTPGPSAAIADLRPDAPGLEIATGNEEYYPLSGNLTVKGRWFLFGADGTVVWWKDTENDEAHSSVNLGDVNRTGTLKMVGGTTSGNQVQVWDAWAKWVWRYVYEGHVVSTPAIGKTDPATEGLDVISGSFDGHVHAFGGATGALKWTFDTRTEAVVDHVAETAHLLGGSQIWSSPALADLSGDGAPEVVVGCDNGKVYCLDARTGALRWKTSIVLSGTPTVRGSAALLPAGHPLGARVFIGSPDGRIVCLSGATGGVLWSVATGSGIVSSPALGDLNSDGSLELVFGSGDGRVWCLDAAGGGLRWSYRTGGAVHSSPALARRAAGRGLDVYAASMDGGLYLLHGATGALLAKFQALYAIVSSPVVGDVDGDGKLEIVFQDRFADINGRTGDRFWCVRDQGSAVRPFTVEWGMFRADPAHTGLYRGAPPAPGGVAAAAPAEGRQLRLTWNAVAAADLAGYRVYRATHSPVVIGGAFSPAATIAAPGTTLQDGGLADGVTYYYRVAAADDSGNESAGSPEASGTPQDIVPPMTPSGFGAADVPDDPGGVLKIAWGTGTEPDLAGYRLTRSKLSNGAWEKDEFLPAGVTVHLDVGLTDYVNYFYTLRAEDRAGNGSASVMVSTMPKPSEVFVAPPPPPQASGSAPSLGRAAQVSWTIPPGGIGVVVCQSTIAPVLQPIVYQGSGTALTQGGLANGVTSWYTIRTVDAVGRLSSPIVVVVIPQRTAPLPPVEKVVGIGGTAGQVSWSYPGDPDVKRVWVYVATMSYRTDLAFLVYSGTGTSLSFPAFPGTTHYVTISVCGPHAHELEVNPEPEHCAESEIAVAGPPAPAVTTTVATSTTAASSGGGASSPAVPAGAGLQAGPPPAVSAGVPPSGTAKAAIKTPTDGKRIRGNAVTVIAESADQPKGVLLQYRAEKAQDWRDITSRDDKPPYAVYWNVSALTNGPYRLRAVAYDSANRPDPAPAEISVTVDDVNADVVEDGNPSVDPNTPHRKEEKVSESQEAVVVVADGTKVEVPKGAVKGSTSLTITVVPPAEAAHVAPPRESTLKSAGVYREFKVSGQITFEKPVTITLPYPDEDHDDVVDGTAIKKSDLRLHFRNEKSGEWEEVRDAKPVKIAHAPGEPSGALGAALYPQGNAVVASVDHFTLFGLFARAAKADLSEVIVYPNPCLPSEGQAGVTFDGLPAGQVRVRIYTVSGRVVRDASVESAGTWMWNLLTDDGEPAASGAYLYVVTAPGLGTAKGKVALVR